MRVTAVVFIALALGACRDDPLADAREFWNATYREPRAFPASAFLQSVVKNQPPGRALDICMGQGRNALFLASRGWKVTGIDISDEGLRRARAAAARRKLAIKTILGDVGTWDHGEEAWDLVLLIYADDDVNKVSRSLKHGGLIVSERFHVDANPRIGTTPEAFARTYADGFEILRNEVVEEVSVWGGPSRQPEKVVHFAARKL
ncbi:MAG TPA: class I SAM-dependent methyltransferase [Polyangiaceae bacterium]|jgi:SAM-dependent methyltransferase|nr:class I SAM-dependent methyltransferase [Polyangiaceae bacterium]